MSTILDRIIATKQTELVERKRRESQAELETRLANASLPNPKGFVDALRKQAMLKQP